MKLTLQQLEQHAAKSFATIYFISGDEILLLQEAVDFLRETAKQKGFSERVHISPEENAEWGKQLYADAHSLSLFAEKRILELDLRGAKITQANSELLQKYAENPPPDTVLIIFSNKLDGKSEQSKWYKALDKNGVIISVWPVTFAQLPQWIMQRARKSQLILTEASARFLAERAEGNLLAAAQEIEKLCLLRGEDKLDEQSLKEIIADHAHFDIFNLVDCVLSGNSKRSLQILRNLLAENTEPVLINWALTRELTTLAEISQQISQGISLSLLFSQFKIWEKRQPLVRAFLKRNTTLKCWDGLLHAAKIDRIIKGAEPGNTQDELERLVLYLGIT
ncbi:MAG TPA: DNA polymerase III subunit delta [Gammaproteobacteria bacterium]|nr:DNA polymerase III subunit delta [Gammaproteobacteria bacterium]